MPLHDFTALYQFFPETIATMSSPFTSHSFIITLAQRHQRKYAEALYSYRNTTHQGTPAPFLNVHRELARALRDFPQLVEYVTDVKSIDIFTQENKCSQWRKL